MVTLIPYLPSEFAMTDLRIAPLIKSIQLDAIAQRFQRQVGMRPFSRARNKAVDKAQFALMDFIISTALNSAFRHDLNWQIETFKEKSAEQQKKLFPGFYLFIERYIFNSMETSQQTFREVLYQQFQFAIDQIPALKLIFLPELQQKKELYKSFLFSVARRSLHHSHAALIASELTQWLEGNHSIFAAIPGYQNETRVYIEVSREYFRMLKENIGDRHAIKVFNDAYQKLALRYQNLDTFPEILKLFPHQALDEAKYNLLSLQQMKKLLAEKVTKLEQVSNELHEKNKLLEQSNDELLAQSDLLNEQNLRLTEAQSLIQLMNEELASHSRKLEAKVLERTEELAHSNDLLRVHNQNLEQYTFTISHQLKAPIARLLGLTNLLNLVPAQEVPVVGKSVHASAKELEDVFKQLVHSLNLNKEAAEVKKERVDVKAVLQSTWDRISAATSGREVEFVLKGEGIAKTDRRHLSEAVHHLLQNAMKFAHTSAEHRVEVDVYDRPGRVEIKIKDNGVGFNLEEHKEKLFAPYQRFNMTFSGRGMGLYLTKQHVAILGGDIRIASKINTGTEVQLELPHLFSN